MRVEDPRHLHPLSQAWVAAATASGLAANDDFNEAAQDGVGFYQATQRAGRRWSTAERLPAAGHRPGQPDGGDRRPGHRGADRGRAGRRGPLPPGRRRARGPRRPSARRAASNPPATPPAHPRPARPCS
ncbi:MAG TPA: GMC family oxidoreductase N-terminal domain-containing protein [Actinomycetota bacterium]